MAVVYQGCNGIIAQSNGKQLASVSLFADAKTDISGDFEIEGLPNDYEPYAGSSVLTASGEVAFLQSDGTWTWQ